MTCCPRSSAAPCLEDLIEAREEQQSQKKPSLSFSVVIYSSPATQTAENEVSLQSRHHQPCPPFHMTNNSFRPKAVGLKAHQSEHKLTGYQKTSNLMSQNWSTPNSTQFLWRQSKTIRPVSLCETQRWTKERWSPLKVLQPRKLDEVHFKAVQNSLWNVQVNNSGIYPGERGYERVSYEKSFRREFVLSETL